MGASIALDDYFDADLDLEILGEDFMALSGPNEGKHWMLCNAQGPMGFFYNQDIFDEEGLPYPEADWTWDDLLELALKLTKRDGEQIERYGVSVSRMHSFIWQNEGRYFDANNVCVLDEPAAVEAIQWEADLYFKHKVAPLPAALEMQPTTFQNGRIAMAWGDGPWSCPGYRTAEFRWDVVPVPQGKIPAVINYGSGMAISSDSPAKESAWIYAKHWLEELPQIEFHSTWESMPILKKTLHDLFEGRLRPESPTNYNMFAEAITGPTKYSVVEQYSPGANSWYSPWGSTFMNEVVSLARLGEGTAEELAGPFVQKFNDWLDQNTNWLKA
jgi:ABC-type glycerol-3-phosphate transport system substrate-binding protein